MSENGRPPDDWTLTDARRWLRGRVEDGEACPCCGQFAKVYKRKLTASQVHTLGRVLARQRDGDWVHLPSIPQRSRDFSTTAYFDLAVEERVRRPDGGRSGWWRVTRAGEAFLRGHHKVTKYARVFDNRRLGFTGDPVGVHDVAPEFRFDDLMRGE